MLSLIRAESRPWRRLLEPLFPLARELYPRALATDLATLGLAPLIFVAAPLSIQARAFVATLLIGASLAGLPGAIYAILRKLEHYSQLTQELPFIVVHALVITSSCGSVDEVFRVERSGGFRAFRVECKKFAVLRSLGKSWDEALSVLEKESSSEHYKEFLRGLLIVGTTSGRVPEYLENYLRELMDEFRERWRRFWGLCLGAIEVALVLGVAIITLSIAAVLVDTHLFARAVNLVTLSVMIAELSLIISINTSRPASLSLHDGSLLLPSALGALFSLVLALSLMRSGASSATIAISAGVPLLLCGIPLLVESERAMRLEQRVLQALSAVKEGVKAGLSYQDAIERAGIAAICELAASSRVRRQTSVFVKHVVESLEEFGAAYPGFLELVYFSLHDVVLLERRFRSSSLLLQASALIIPAVLLVFAMRLYAYVALFPQIEGGLAVGAGLSQSFAPNIALCFVSLGAAVNLVVSSAVDYTSLSTARSGLALILLAALLRLNPS
ncbi:MAG: type II secretion system F family protein [Fervidicoccaceae archaeon]